MAVPASLLSGLGAPFNTLDLQGDVRLALAKQVSHDHVQMIEVFLNELRKLCHEAGRFTYVLRR